MQKTVMGFTLYTYTKRFRKVIRSIRTKCTKGFLPRDGWMDGRMEEGMEGGREGVRQEMRESGKEGEAEKEGEGKK